MDKRKSTPPALMPLALALLLQACASNSVPIAAPPPKPPRIPALPPQARQPTPPSICSPTCSAALTTERANWQRSLTWPTPPAAPVNAPTTPSTAN